MQELEGFLTLTQRDEFRSDGHSANYFYAYDGFERFQLARLRDRKLTEQLFERALLRDIFNGGLRADGCGTCQNQHSMSLIQPPLQRPNRVIFRHGFDWRGRARAHR